LSSKSLRYRDSVDNTVEENSNVFSLIGMRAPVAVSKGTQAVKLCTNKILQFLTGGRDDNGSMGHGSRVKWVNKSEWVTWVTGQYS